MGIHTIRRRFDHPPAAIWAGLADTGRYNEAAGLPRHAIDSRPQPDGTVRHFGRARLGGFLLEWEEVPVEWVDCQWFQHTRIFSRGPIARLTATLALSPVDGAAATDASYAVEAVPRGLLGRLLLATGFWSGVERMFGRAAATVEEWAAGRRDRPFDPPPRPPAPALLARARAALARTEHQALARRLLEELAGGLESDLLHLRPLALARRWGAPPRPVLEACLGAVAEGVMDMRWDLLCPRCRGAKLSADALDRLPAGAHCQSCNIDYGRDFDRNVELTFRPAPWLRPLNEGEFCLIGPMSTPHVKAQIALAPGQTRRIAARLAPGPYRLRTLEAGGAVEVDHDGGVFPGILVDGGEVAAMPGEAGHLLLHNGGTVPRTAVIEDRGWVAEALTAHRVTTLQCFRDLFPRAGLKPGEEAPVAQVALVFTDLKASTALYDRLGDMAAYAVVRRHFAFLGEIVRRHDGAVVKTIGDAVMAAFREPADAVAAALAIQRRVADFNAGEGEADALAIRVGVHAGPCICVTMNDRLDYFGHHVNLAARLQGQSRGGDIVLGPGLADDRLVAPLLAGLPRRDETAAIRGFAAPVALTRIAIGG